ncbi:related to molybdopterin synthase large subunit [Ustilago trichophora]|uniref:Related to molybdopterin synthase large subunit n=1 Tax=Ustilago trichophora TaxID=86804 RepID=A0A5C3DYM5_9BASI|nr:related to molybdopterin synthase large subunit [Ustilago trichophora]
MASASADVGSSLPTAYPPSSVPGRIKSSHGDEAVLTYDELQEKEAIRIVADDGAGATVLFSGTTRDLFKGKQVIKLEYEAYTSLALKTLSSLLEKAHTSAPFLENPIPRSANAAPASISEEEEDRITRCYIAHRLGEVAVGQCSIVIAVSSPHRKEAFVVAEWLLEEVKKNVAVWKREFYAQGEMVTALDGQDAPIDRDEGKKAGEDGGSAHGENAKSSSWSWKANFPTS